MPVIRFNGYTSEPVRLSTILGAMITNPNKLREQKLKELLVKKGFRVTQQRLSILGELAQLRVPVSHSELADRLPDLDRVTVYRTLLSMTDAGVLVRTQLGDNVWRFGLPQVETGKHGAHPHFVCNDCGDVQCLSERDVRLGGGASKNQVAEVQLRGRCITCVAGR